jgi:predicted fused transcriptional regulator/phosphomethylpyrimidine kinase
VPADPEFGVSEHVAGVLLAARSAGIDARAAINVRYEAALVAALATDHQTVEFDPDEPIDAAIETRAAERPVASVFYQTGGFGVEPIVYLLADDAVAAAEQIRAVAE